ncbi:hypothetical protein BKA61DRAFT_611841 [Leptodontidium sp. MPI-SDFR-AT-0119]|nr:hypothetical protein BKA61DRAFT_611841 [Leptodontidium sp. MPI-SDFR-AT-0119]
MMTTPVPGRILASRENQGLVNLQSLVDQIANRTPDTSVPIVLVSGFSGWGEALFGTFNYWGGFEDLPAVLHAAGYTVIVVHIGPLSSNWERACQVYEQLTSANFDVPNALPPTTIPIDYGTVYPARYGYARHSNCSKAVLYGNLPTGWNWGTKSPVHCICHSQGGNTIRLLVELLRGNYGNLHPTYFTATDNRQNMINSVVTLGTPHKGTTITAVVQNLLPPDSLGLITQFIVSVSFRRPRFYDLQLDNWGFYRLPNESFRSMCARLRPLVQVWWEGPQNPVFPPHNGFYDNSIPGVNALNEFAPAPAPNTFYFTMSFDATEDFPNVRLSSADFATFPVTLPLSLLNSHNISGTVTSIGLNVFLSWVPGAPTLVNLAKWAVRVANTHLGALGYFNKIPQPGPKVPRADMLPIMLPTAYGMGGYELPAQFAQLIPGVSSAELQSNDGIVNTVSMRGPNDAQVSNVANFPVRSLERHTSDTTAKATYWHLGINKTMDHGDEIGVFTVGETYEEVKQMYLEFAMLLARLPLP